MTTDAIVKPKSKRGFASMSKERQKEIAAKGGRRAHELGVGYQYTSETAAIAGRLGGKATAKNKKGGQHEKNKNNSEEKNSCEKTSEEKNKEIIL